MCFVCFAVLCLSVLIQSIYVKICKYHRRTDKHIKIIVQNLTKKTTKKKAKKKNFHRQTDGQPKTIVRNLTKYHFIFFNFAHFYTPIPQVDVIYFF